MPAIDGSLNSTVFTLFQGELDIQVRSPLSDKNKPAGQMKTQLSLWSPRFQRALFSAQGPIGRWLSHLSKGVDRDHKNGSPRDCLSKMLQDQDDIMPAKPERVCHACLNRAVNWERRDP